jgi:hypothetical protein
LAKKPDSETTDEEQEFEVRQLREMVQARSLIQPELIELLEFQRRYHDDLTPSLYIRIAGLLASAGFSLWRAAFLFKEERGQHDEYLKNVGEFISKIILTNNIGFSDDRNTWSLWHYIGVARSSLLEALNLLRTFPEDHKIENMRNRFSDPPLLSATAAEQWNELFVAMQFVRKTLTARFDKARSMPKLF